MGFGVNTYCIDGYNLIGVNKIKETKRKGYINNTV